MNRKYLDLLCCPICKGELLLDDKGTKEQRIKEGILHCERCDKNYPILRYIPRFVDEDNYATNFGYQWRKHAHTQLDRFTGTNASETRLFEATKWPRNLAGKRVLEVGSGAGRFTEHLVESGAMVVSVDYSNAVETNLELNGANENVLIVQGDIYCLPLQESAYHLVMCFGVLQHTPDVGSAFRELPKYLADGGRLAIDVYRKDRGIRRLLKLIGQTKYWVRPITKRLNPKTLYRVVETYVSLIWPIARLVASLPWVGRYLVQMMLVADVPVKEVRDRISDERRREWAILDTFDWLSPAYDKPQTIETVRRWFDSPMFTEVEVNYGYNGIEGRAVKSMGNVNMEEQSMDEHA